MSIKSASRKTHNPKSYAPSVYIPCWLIQVPHDQLSFGSKLLYGRLAQWSSNLGEVFRSAPQLSKELGIAVRTIKKFIKELKDCNLIGTHQPKAGGLNHFLFYDHEWMYVPLVDELNYTQESVHNNALPSAQPCTGVVHNRAPINIKEIELNKTKEKIDKKEKTSRSQISDDFLPTEAHTVFASEHDINLDAEKAAFVDYYVAHGKTMANWNAAFSGWLRRSLNFRKNFKTKEHPVTASIRELKESVNKDLINSEEFKSLLSF